MPDDRTPLLPTEAQQNSRTDGRSLSVDQGRGSGVSILDQATRRRSIIPTEEYDNNELVRERSRLSSYSVVLVPDKLKKDDDDNEVETNLIENTVGEAMAEGGAEVYTDPNTKYMNISTGRFWLVFLTIMSGHIVACFDITLMASIHPVITSAFDASELASWLTTSFIDYWIVLTIIRLTNTGFQPLWGRLSDLIGRKSIYILLLALFALTNLWCGLCTDILSFIAARAVCGIAAGGLISLGVVITNDLVKLEHRGTFISHLNVAFGIGAGLGAALGGVICDSIGWRWCFGIQVPILVVCVTSGFFTIPKNLGPVLISKSTGSALQALKNFDTIGLILVLCAATCWVLFFNLGGNEYSWDDPVIITCLVLGIILSAILLWVENRAVQPVLPLHLLVTPPYMNLTYANFLAGVASNTVLFNAPLWFQAVELDSPSSSGLRLAAPAIGTGIAGLLTGNIITYTKRLKPMLIVGAVCYLAGSIALFFIDRRMSEVEKVALITPTPLSQGFIFPASMMSAFASSSQEDQGVVTTTMTLWRNLGIVVGVSISSLVFQNMLNVELEKNVRGPEAQHVIDVARGSVRAIGGLPVFYREQVIESYANALKLSFVTAIVASGILLLILLPIRLPRLRKVAEISMD